MRRSVGFHNQPKNTRPFTSGTTIRGCEVYANSDGCCSNCGLDKMHHKTTKRRRPRQRMSTRAFVSQTARVLTAFEKTLLAPCVHGKKHGECGSSQCVPWSDDEEGV